MRRARAGRVLASTAGARTALARTALAGTALAGMALAGTVGLGLLLGWSAHSRSLLLVLLAGALAAMNGYSKAYSP